MNANRPATDLNPNLHSASNGGRAQAIDRAWITPDMIRGMRPPPRLKVVAEGTAGAIAGRFFNGRVRP